MLEIACDAYGRRSKVHKIIKYLTQSDTDKLHTHPIRSEERKQFYENL
jgi:hypothetical protein